MLLLFELNWDLWPSAKLSQFLICYRRPFLHSEKIVLEDQPPVLSPFTLQDSFPWDHFSEDLKLYPPHHAVINLHIFIQFFLVCRQQVQQSISTSQFTDHLQKKRSYNTSNLLVCLLPIILPIQQFPLWLKSLTTAKACACGALFSCLKKAWSALSVADTYYNITSTGLSSDPAPRQHSMYSWHSFTQWASCPSHIPRHLSWRVCIPPLQHTNHKCYPPCYHNLGEVVALQLYMDF